MRSSVLGDLPVCPTDLLHIKTEITLDLRARIFKLDELLLGLILNRPRVPTSNIVPPGTFVVTLPKSSTGNFLFSICGETSLWVLLSVI